MSLGLGNHSNNFSVNTAYMCFWSLRNCAHLHNMTPCWWCKESWTDSLLRFENFLNTHLLLKPLTDGFPSHSSSQKSSITLLSFYRPCNNLTLSGSMLISMLPSIFLQPCSVYPSVSFNDALLLVLMIIQYVREVLAYLRFGLWWVGLGAASSIGLGMNALSCP
jgi:hypothetical protein